MTDEKITVYAGLDPAGFETVGTVYTPRVPGRPRVQGRAAKKGQAPVKGDPGADEVPEQYETFYRSSSTIGIVPKGRGGDLRLLANGTTPLAEDDFQVVERGGIVYVVGDGVVNHPDVRASVTQFVDPVKDTTTRPYEGIHSYLRKGKEFQDGEHTDRDIFTPVTLEATTNRLAMHIEKTLNKEPRDVTLYLRITRPLGDRHDKDEDTEYGLELQRQAERLLKKQGFFLPKVSIMSEPDAIEARIKHAKEQGHLQDFVDNWNFDAGYSIFSVGHRTTQLMTITPDQSRTYLKLPLCAAGWYAPIAQHLDSLAREALEGSSFEELLQEVQWSLHAKDSTPTDVDEHFFPEWMNGTDFDHVPLATAASGALKTHLRNISRASRTALERRKLGDFVLVDGQVMHVPGALEYFARCLHTDFGIDTNRVKGIGDLNPYRKWTSRDEGDDVPIGQRIRAPKLVVADGAALQVWNEVQGTAKKKAAQFRSRRRKRRQV